MARMTLAVCSRSTSPGNDGLVSATPCALARIFHEDGEAVFLEIIGTGARGYYYLADLTVLSEASCQQTTLVLCCQAFSGVEERGYLDVQEGDALEVLAIDGEWAYAKSDAKAGWVLSSHLAQPLPRDGESWTAVHVDGATDDARGFGAAAVIATTASGPQGVAVCSVPGYYVGPGASELTAVLLGLRTVREYYRTHRTKSRFCIYTDSSHTARYLAGGSPVAEAGLKLRALIEYARTSLRETSLLVGGVHIGWRSRSGNLADPHARGAMRAARAAAWQRGPLGVEEEWLLPLADVAAATRRVHPGRG